MSKHEPKPAQPAAPGHDGYERSDADAASTYRAGFYILGVMFLVALVVVPLYRLFVRVESRSQPERATVVRETPVARPFPKLVTNEPLALAELRAQEDQWLEGYAWVEKDRGIARMPIAEAMRLVGERGALPVLPSPAPTAEPAAAAARASR